MRAKGGTESVHSFVTFSMWIDSLSWRLSVRPAGTGVGNIYFVKKNWGDECKYVSWRVSGYIARDFWLYSKKSLAI